MNSRFLDVSTCKRSKADAIIYFSRRLNLNFCIVKHANCIKIIMKKKLTLTMIRTKYTINESEILKTLNSAFRIKILEFLAIKNEEFLYPALRHEFLQ